MAYPYSEEDEKFDREFNSVAGVIVGVWVFFVGRALLKLIGVV